MKCHGVDSSFFITIMGCREKLDRLLSEMPRGFAVQISNPEAARLGFFNVIVRVWFAIRGGDQKQCGKYAKELLLAGSQVP